MDIDRANTDRREQEGKWTVEPDESSQNTEVTASSGPEISTLPELKALDPDLVAETLKIERKVRRRIQ